MHGSCLCGVEAERVVASSEKDERQGGGAVVQGGWCFVWGGEGNACEGVSLLSVCALPRTTALPLSQRARLPTAARAVPRRNRRSVARSSPCCAAATTAAYAGS